MELGNFLDFAILCTMQGLSGTMYYALSGLICCRRCTDYSAYSYRRWRSLLCLWPYSLPGRHTSFKSLLHHHTRMSLDFAQHKPGSDLKDGHCLSHHYRHVVVFGNQRLHFLGEPFLCVGFQYCSPFPDDHSSSKVSCCKQSMGRP